MKNFIKINSKLKLLIFLTFITAFIICKSSLKEELNIGLNPNTVTISGLSSGGYMAGQFHLSHSEKIKGVGIFSAGPYYCSQGEFAKVPTDCMANPENIDLNYLLQIALEHSKLNLIDNLVNLKKSKVFNFIGLKDSRVLAEVSKKVDLFYQNLNANVKTEILEDSEHAFPTENKQNNKCDYLGSPFINNCEYNGALNALKYIGNPDTFNEEKVKEKQDMLKYIQFKPDNLIEIDQRPFFSYEKICMNDKGFIYIPDNCKDNKKVCDLHVVFHGCKQTIEHIGKSFIEKTGFLEISELFDLVVLFPQALKSEDQPFNPNGCWDFWGYNTSLQIFETKDGEKNYFSTKKGKQINAVWKIINDLVDFDQSEFFNLTKPILE